MEKRARSRYGWENMLDGEWHKVHSVDPEVAWAQGYRISAIRTAAYMWARAHGWKAQSSVSGGGAELHVRFHKEAS